MITPEQMYCLTRLDRISCTIITCTVLLCIAYGIGLMFGLVRYFDNFHYGPNDKDLKEAKLILRFIAKYSFVPIAGIAMSCLIPTTREMAAILVVPRIANSEKVQQAGNKLYDLAVEWMDELKPNKNKNQK